MAAALLVFPIATLVTEAATAQRQPTLHRPEGVENLAGSSPTVGLTGRERQASGHLLHHP